MPEKLCQTILETSLGPLRAVTSDQGLCVLEFSSRSRPSSPESRMARWFEDYQIAEVTHPIFDRTRTWLTRYFAGRFRSLKLPPLDLRGTGFERAVWNRLLQIPLGSTVTYGELASKLGLTNGARAVGLAVGRNPVGLIVPCHRVIGKGGSLTGYGGGLERKRWLLGHEGAMTPELFRYSAAGKC